MLPENAALEQQIQQAQKKLAPYLLSGYQKQAHITLYAAGFLVAKKHQKDDVTKALLAQQADTLRAMQLPILHLQSGAINSFSGAPFIEIHESNGHLQAIQYTLSQQFGADRDSSFLAHMTLGLYKQRFASKAIADLLQTIEQQAITFDCSKIHLISYSSNDIRSPLKSLMQLNLG